MGIGSKLKEQAEAVTTMEDTVAFGKNLVESVNADHAAQEKDLQTGLRRNGKPRSMTVLKLQWLAERARKCMAIKDAIEQGTYKISSRDVARVILNVDESENQNL